MQDPFAEMHTVLRDALCDVTMGTEGRLFCTSHVSPPHHNLTSVLCQVEVRFSETRFDTTSLAENPRLNTKISLLTSSDLNVAEKKKPDAAALPSSSFQRAQQMALPPAAHTCCWRARCDAGSASGLARQSRNTGDESKQGHFVAPHPACSSNIRGPSAVSEHRTR